MSATTLPSNRNWLRRLITGQPHQIIPSADDPYLLRWYIIPLNVYLHKFMRSDDDRALHDHPSDSPRNGVCRFPVTLSGT